MSPELDRILAGKDAMRLRLAALPIADKLRILDELRAREMSIRARRQIEPGSESGKPAAGTADTR